MGFPAQYAERIAKIGDKPLRRRVRPGRPRDDGRTPQPVSVRRPSQVMRPDDRSRPRAHWRLTRDRRRRQRRRRQRQRPSCSAIIGARVRTTSRGGMEAIGSMLFISNPISGLATGPQWLPHPWGTIGQFLPVGAAGTALRSVAYFDGRGRLRPGSSCSAGPSAGSSCCRSASGARQRTDGQPGRDERRGIIRARSIRAGSAPAPCRGGPVAHGANRAQASQARALRRTRRCRST